MISRQKATKLREEGVKHEGCKESHHESHDSIPSRIRRFTYMLDYIKFVLEPMTVSFGRNRKASDLNKLLIYRVLSYRSPDSIPSKTWKEIQFNDITFVNKNF